MTGQLLVGKSVIVTGGGTGIGYACARTLARDGAHVTICGRSEATLRLAVERGREAIAGDASIRYVVADATIEDDMARVVDAAIGSKGTLDGVVANAGGGGMPGAVHQQDLDEFSRIVKVNLVSALVTVKSTIPALLRAGGGSIVFISSLNGDARVAANYTSAYSAAKAGIDQMMRVAAAEYGRNGIRVNSIRPGYVHTEINDKYVGEGTAFYQSCRDNVLLDGPLADPDDIANLARFLIGPESRFITGQAINVDGGQSLRSGPDSTGLMHMAGLLE